MVLHAGRILQYADFSAARRFTADGASALRPNSINQVRAMPELKLLKRRTLIVLHPNQMGI